MREAPVCQTLPPTDELGVRFDCQTSMTPWTLNHEYVLGCKTSKTRWMGHTYDVSHPGMLSVDSSPEAYLAILAHKVPLFCLQHVVVSNELRLQGSECLACLSSILAARTPTYEPLLCTCILRPEVPLNWLHGCSIDMGMSGC